MFFLQYMKKNTNSIVNHYPQNLHNAIEILSITSLSLKAPQAFKKRILLHDNRSWNVGT